MPAIVNGCFGLRITHGVVDTAGVVPSFRYVLDFVILACTEPVFSPFDVPCLFARDVKVLEVFTRVWLPLQDRQPIEKVISNCNMISYETPVDAGPAAKPDCLA